MLKLLEWKTSFPISLTPHTTTPPPKSVLRNCTKRKLLQDKPLMIFSSFSSESSSLVRWPLQHRRKGRPRTIKAGIGYTMLKLLEWKTSFPISLTSHTMTPPPKSVLCNFTKRKLLQDEPLMIFSSFSSESCSLVRWPLRQMMS